MNGKIFVVFKNHVFFRRLKEMMELENWNISSFILMFVCLFVYVKSNCSVHLKLNWIKLITRLNVFFCFFVSNVSSISNVSNVRIVKSNVTIYVSSDNQQRQKTKWKFIFIFFFKKIKISNKKILTLYAHL